VPILPPAPPLLGFAHFRPSAVYSSARPLPEVKPKRPFLRKSDATRTSCSVLTVSHRLDGFLRASACGFVAPRCRPWGSTRFLRACSKASKLPSPLRTNLAVLAPPITPSEEFPSSSAAPHHCGRCPPALTIPSLTPPPRRTVADPEVQRIPLKTAHFRAFLRRRVRCDPRRFPTRCRPFLPWACFPSKVQRAPVLVQPRLQRGDRRPASRTRDPSAVDPGASQSEASKVAT